MIKRIKEYIKYTKRELEEYTKIEGSCVKKINSTIHIGFPPHGMSNFQKHISETIAHQKIGFFDTKLEGIILDVKNIKVMGTTGSIRADDPIIHLNIKADCYVFQPQTAAVIRGVVKHISSSGGYIGVIIYRVFSVSIKLQDQVCRNIEINSEIEFRIKSFDLQGVMPFIEGELVAKEEKPWNANNDFSDNEDDKLSDASSNECPADQNGLNNRRQINYAGSSDAESEDLFEDQKLQNSTQMFMSSHLIEQNLDLKSQENSRINISHHSTNCVEIENIKTETLSVDGSQNCEEKIKRERTMSDTLSSSSSINNLDDLEREIHFRESGNRKQNNNLNKSIKVKGEKFSDIESVQDDNRKKKSKTKKKESTSLNKSMQKVNKEKHNLQTTSDAESTTSKRSKKKSLNLDDSMRIIIEKIKKEKNSQQELSQNSLTNAEVSSSFESTRKIKKEKLNSSSQLSEEESYSTQEDPKKLNKKSTQPSNGSNLRTCSNDSNSETGDDRKKSKSSRKRKSS